MSADAWLAADRAARLTALSVTRSFIVQAPAGSGKTELLIQRYLKLLATVDHPEEVLAITFTLKAAQEMRHRVVTALQRARNGDEPIDAHHKVTFDAAVKVLERDREQAWQLIDSPRRMRIQTLDALNSSIARSLPFSSGLGGAARVATDEEMKSLYRSAGAATLDWLLAGNDEARAVEQLLVHLDNNAALYIAHVASMLETRDQWLPIVGSGAASGLGRADADDAVRGLLEKNIANRVTAHLQTVARLLPVHLAPELLRLGAYAASNIAADDKNVHLYAVFEACDGLPPALADRVGDWCGIAELLLTRSGDFRKSVNKNNGFPPGDQGQKKEMQELLATLAEHAEFCAALHRVRQLPAPRYTDGQWRVLLALFRLLPLAVTELRRLFTEKGVTDYTEVAIAADDALGGVDDPGDIALLLDYGVRHLLIDEMQDTSIAQYRLLEKLVAGWQPGDGRTLFCVGDPMQSIYRFRNAEVGQFLLARNGGIGGVELEPLLLRQNFRSGERLVHWFNTVFEQALPAANDIAVGAISYSSSVPVAAHRDAGDCTIHPLFGAKVEDEAECGVQVIRQCLNTSGTHKTAVLVRSRTQLPLLLAKLREAGIDYQAIEIDRLTDLPEIIEVLALTRAICHRSDRIAWLALLRAPWVGLTWTDLHTLVRGASALSVWELVHDEARLSALTPDARLRIRSFTEKLAPFVAGHGTASLRDTVERAWYALGGPLLTQRIEQVDNVYRFLDVVERIETAGTLADVAELETTLDQERVSSGGDQGGRLQIMTMHKAKGLEFDHVVLYGLGRRSRGSRKSVLSWLTIPDSTGNREMLISPIGPRAMLESDPLHAYIEATELEKERLEHCRLLYVACTRARISLHLLGHVDLTGQGDDFGTPPAGTLLHGIWPMVRPVFDTAFRTRQIPHQAAQPAGADGTFRKPELRRLGEHRQLPPAPALPRLDGTDTLDEIDGYKVDYYWVGSIARHAGTIVHRWLKRISDGLLEIDVADVADLLPASRNWAKELGVPVADTDAVCNRVMQALTDVLEDERGRWIVFGDGHAELPITGLWNERIESIVVDRVRVDHDGVHWIVDYKTSTHEGGDLDAFLQREAERYRQQLTKYAFLYRQLVDAPVRTALYFPLLKEFREVPIDGQSTV